MHRGNGDRKTLIKRNSVYKLDPFMDKKGLLRVGEWLRKPNLHITQYYSAKIVASLDWFWNGVIRRWLMVEEDSPSIKLGAMDFGLFNATQLLRAC